jgi:DNA helicase-4
MAQHWQPSGWGRWLTRSPHWSLQLEGATATLAVDSRRYSVALHQSQQLQLRIGMMWTGIVLQTEDGNVLRVDGLPNRQASELAAMVDELDAQLQRSAREQSFHAVRQALQRWTHSADALIDSALSQRRWITHEQQQDVLDARPVLPVVDHALETFLLDPDLLVTLPAAERDDVTEALQAWRQDWPQAWAQANEDMLQRELLLAKPLLDRAESKPLSEEQARAVICFENRVQVVAAAGSGKTSTMVAKAAYAIERGLVAPERIVMLAFNKQAADELQQRADAAFDRLGIDGSQLQARTFHALGLQIIAKATGRKPDIPDWAIDPAAGYRKLAELVDALKDRSIEFRTQWDMFRLVFGRDLPALGAAMAADGFERDGTPFARTLNGERVKSLEECVIADWLFYNGVNYAYEDRYRFDTATEQFRQYKPDFHYPDVDLYHEHFALDAQGNLPPQFGGYMDGVLWKRAEHARRGTQLIETTSHQLRCGTAFEHLDRQLTRAGLQLDPNPDREIPADGQTPLPDDELIGLMRIFIGHAKSNCLGVQVLADRLNAMPEGQFKERHRRFLEISVPVFQAWDDALVAEGGIDFEDMLNQAAALLEAGTIALPYDLVLADEFQDASRARARLCRALVSQPDKHLFAVGDDWQSINRFAGADVSVMTGFADYFGHGQVLKLEQTFRCPQALCDIASNFISKNPAQLRKQVRSHAPQHGPVLQAWQVTSREQIQTAIGRYLAQLHEQLATGQITRGRNGKLSVFVLGRYNADRAYIPTDWQRRFGQWLELDFLTMHRSKGAEADYVILPAMLDRGFPSQRADDPVLSLAMPGGDDYPLGEERRLFYVALTRARRGVAMFTVLGKRSPFIDELCRDGVLTVTNSDGEAINEQRCPACGTGVIVQRTGPYGDFHSCSSYPRCQYKPPKHYERRPRPATAL